MILLIYIVLFYIFLAKTLRFFHLHGRAYEPLLVWSIRTENLSTSGKKLSYLMAKTNVCCTYIVFSIFLMGRSCLLLFTWDFSDLIRWNNANANRYKFSFQGNMLVHRGSLNHFLSNGIELSFLNNGAISFDLSGQVSEKNGLKKINDKGSW